jgi:hypothetical protein
VELHAWQSVAKITQTSRQATAVARPPRRPHPLRARGSSRVASLLIKARKSAHRYPRTRWAERTVLPAPHRVPRGPHIFPTGARSDLRRHLAHLVAQSSTPRTARSSGVRGRRGRQAMGQFRRRRTAGMRTSQSQGFQRRSMRPRQRPAMRRRFRRVRPRRSRPRTSRGPSRWGDP